MKRMCLLFVAVVAAISMTAQDIIVMKNGDLIQSKVQEITQTEIKYKKYSNPNGPLYTIDKAAVLSINYENGEKEMMAVSEEPAPAKEQVAEAHGAPVLIEKETAPNNDELIQKYHPKVDFVLKPSDKDAKYAYSVMAVTKSSVLSNEDVEISIVPVFLQTDDIRPFMILQHYIRIENKTDKTIYVDRANSFRIANNGISQPYYDSKQYSVTSGSGSGIGVNLGGMGGVLAGGVSLGGGSTTSVTETHGIQRILTISPHSAAYLSEYKYIMVKKTESKVISQGEWWDTGGNFDYGIVKRGECITYSEDESPYHNEYHITYSAVPGFDTYSTIKFGVYAKYLIGIGVSGTKAGNGNNFILSQRRAIKERQKVISNYGTTPGILYGEPGLLSGAKLGWGIGGI